jgi:hypothetical protein
MDLLSFSTGYTSQDQVKFSFNWNGKHAKELVDSNQEFRRNLIKFVIENDQLYFPIDLIRDIYLEEAKWSVQAWSVGFDFHKLGERLIRFGKNMYINDFLIGAFSSFDTYCSSRMMNLEIFEVELVLEELKRRLKDPDFKEYKDKYESGIELFESYIKGNQRQGLYQLNGDVQVTNVRIVKPNNLISRIRTLIKKIKRNL